MSPGVPPRILLLTGPKHAGKTSLGRVLARLRGETFIDLDELVEQQTGKSPRTLYTESPEGFRRAEAQALASLLEAPPDGSPRFILAAGGGLIDNEGARVLLNRPEFFIIALEVSPETAWERIIAGKTLPPFLDTPEPRKTHRDLHQRRTAAYKAVATMTVQGEGKDPEQIGREIIRFFGDLHPPKPPF